MSGFSGAAVVAGLVGQPVAHSLSPLLHNAWIAAAGLDAVYVPFAPKDEVAFETLISAGRAGLIRGLNVTAPFKAQALAAADEVAATASRCGSANLLLFESGRVRADSTDGAGLLAALAEQAPDLSITRGPAVVLGAGGAARAAAAALVDAGASVRILNRSRGRAEALAKDLGPGVRVAEGGATLADAILVINALSAAPQIDVSCLPDNAVLMDMSYRPLETAFLAAGRARGLVGVDGLAMLIGQARPSFEALFGTSVPEIDVRSLALQSLGEMPVREAGL